MQFTDLFTQRKPLIACIHLQALPGAPAYAGNSEEIMEAALKEAVLFKKYGIDGLIVENFRDNPFYPDQLPAETIAAMAVIARAVKSEFTGPVGINALRNDAHSAMAIALAAGADFIRVNIHIGAALTDQGIITGKAHETLRLRKNLGAKILILADIRVKHATPLGNQTIEQEVMDVTLRGLADGIIASGVATGAAVDIKELKEIRKHSNKPLLIGSGTSPQNIKSMAEFADGFIVGSYLKVDGKAGNNADEKRVEQFTQIYHQLISHL